MSKRAKRLFALIGAVVVLVMAFGALAASAQVDEATPETEVAPETDDAPVIPFDRGDRFGHHGLAAGMPDHEALLAEALDITAEELEAAEETARIAAIEQAVEDGLLTQEQADQMLSGSFGLRGPGGRHGMGFPGMGSDDDRGAYLAEALGISVEELQAAQTEAEAAALAEMVDAGMLTQEQADLMLAVHAFKATLDEEALMAEALGISADDLQASRDAGQSLPELMDELGLVYTDVMASRQAAYEAAVADAVSAGILTQDQADQILNGEVGGPGLGGPCLGGEQGGPRGGHHGGHGGFRGFGLPQSGGESTTTTGLDA